MEQAVWSCIVPFEDASESFVHGFEAGTIWQHMVAGEFKIETIAHTENRDLIERMARRQKYEVAFEKTDVEGWIDVLLTKQSTHLSAV